MDMSEEPRVIDGADRRKKRLLDMLAFIFNKEGATDNDIKSFMLIKFGLRHKTAAQYIHEAHLARLITPDGLMWKTTDNYTKLSEYLYS